MAHKKIYLYVTVFSYVSKFKTTEEAWSRGQNLSQSQRRCQFCSVLCMNVVYSLFLCELQ